MWLVKVPASSRFEVKNRTCWQVPIYNWCRVTKNWKSPESSTLLIHFFVSIYLRVLLLTMFATSYAIVSNKEMETRDEKWINSVWRSLESAMLSDNKTKQLEEEFRDQCLCLINSLKRDLFQYILIAIFFYQLILTKMGHYCLGFFITTTRNYDNKCFAIKILIKKSNILL